jgi:GAF domain-containing protein
VTDVDSATTAATGQIRVEGLPSQAESLLDAILAVSTDLDLRSVLTRLVKAASELTRARYGALGVIGRDGDLAEFITTGIDERRRALIGAAPRGHGILGLLIKEPHPLRVADLRDHTASAGVPAHHPPMGSFLGVPIRVRGTVFGNLYLTEKAGGALFSEQDEILVQALASAAGLVIDNARAYGLSERRRQWLEASADLISALEPPASLEDSLARIARHARIAAGAVAAAIIQFPEDLYPIISAVDADASVDITAIVRGVIEDVRSAGEHATAIEADLGERTAVVLPLRAQLTDPGALLVVLERDPAGDGDEREFLAAFADQAAMALDRAQAIEHREELAVVTERERIAKDLHDVVIQRLFATGLKLQGLRAVTDPVKLDERIDDTVGDLDLTIQEIRKTIFDLRSE